ncbi:MAG TPA: hypothetical protein VF629_03790 [Hymenobacter sp.]|jgi:hypothetical protein|uniref:hypothetical protein n=1 Tax=Hymenobacter sp. TaxID=1898978 RepID=UPI002ED7F083
MVELYRPDTAGFYFCFTPSLATYIHFGRRTVEQWAEEGRFDAKGQEGVPAALQILGPAALQVPQRHRRHLFAPELGAEQFRPRPSPNRLPGAGDLSLQKTEGALMSTLLFIG